MIILIDKILENRDYAPNMKLNVALRQFVDDSSKVFTFTNNMNKSIFSPHLLDFLCVMII